MWKAGFVISAVVVHYYCIITIDNLYDSFYQNLYTYSVNYKLENLLEEVPTHSRCQVVDMKHRKREHSYLYAIIYYKK